MKSCSLSCGGQRRSASAWSMSNGVRIEVTFRSGDWRQSFSMPVGLNGSPRREARSYSGPESELAQSEIWFVTPFSETAARNRSDVPTSQFTMNPP